MSESTDGEQSESPSSETTPEVERREAQYWESYRRYPYLLAKLVFYGLLFAGAIWLMTRFSAVVFPLFVALLLAYVLNPAVNFLERKGFGRSLGIVIILFGVLAFGVVFAAFLYPIMADQVSKIGQRAPQAWRFLEQEAFPWFSEVLNIDLPETWEQVVEDYGEEIRDAVPTIAERVGQWTGEVVTQTQIILVSLFNLVMIPIFAFFFLRDFEHGKERMREFIPQGHYEFLIDRLRKMDLAVGRWFRGQIEVSLILAVLYAIGLGIVYGVTGHSVQSGVVLGLLTGFLNVIPYLGFAVGSILAFLVVLIDWTGWGALIGVAAAFAIIQTAESYYITPRVMGDKVGMKPVTVIIVILVGGHAAGLLGVVLAIPVAGAVKVLFPDFVRWYRSSSFYTGVPTGPRDMIPFKPSSDPPQGESEGTESVQDEETDRSSPDGPSGEEPAKMAESESEEPDSERAGGEENDTSDGEKTDEQ